MSHTRLVLGGEWDELPEWVDVSLGGKVMPYVPVTTDLAEEVMSKAKACDENAKLRELFAEVWPIAEYAGYDHELRRARELMRELGIEVGE